MVHLSECCIWGKELFKMQENADVVATELGGVCSFPDGDRSNDVSDQ